MADRKKRRTISGFVTSDSMNKTITVQTERLVQHPLFKKYVRKWSKCYAHDEKNEASIGDKVKLMECRPLSKMKKWRLLEVVSRAGGLR